MHLENRNRSGVEAKRSMTRFSMEEDGWVMQRWDYGEDKESQQFWKYQFIENLSSAQTTGVLERKTAGVKEINGG